MPPLMPDLPNLSDIEQALERVRSFIPPSPLILSNALSFGFGASGTSPLAPARSPRKNTSASREVRLKLESLSPSGSFKVRGAANALLQLPKTEPMAGVVTQSSGNHGKAIAYMAQKLGLAATVCISTLVPDVKRKAIEALGARVVVSGNDQDETHEVALQLASEEGLHFVPAFDHPDIICGQGTLAVELLEQWPEVDTILVPLSGGGLISGVALATKALKPQIRVIGVTVNHGAAMADSLEAGHLVEVEERSSFADALPGGLPADNLYTFRLCSKLLDGVIRVPEDRIAGAMIHALVKERLVLEGGAAIGLAPLIEELPGELSVVGQHVAVVCTGNNVNMEKLLALTQKVAPIQ